MGIEKDNLFTAALLSAIYLYIKDTASDKSLKDFKKACKRGVLEKQIFSRVKTHADFLDILDKSKIFNLCEQTVLSCYEKEALSETALLSNIGDMLKDTSDNERKLILDTILTVAYMDKVITSAEKETLAQLVGHLDLPVDSLDELLSAQGLKLAPKAKTPRKGMGYAIVLVIIVIFIGTPMYFQPEET